MNITHPFPEIHAEKVDASPNRLLNDAPILIKNEEKTATKAKEEKLDENQNGKIRNFIFSLFKQEKLRGHFKVENFDSLEVIEVILFHKINQYVRSNLFRTSRKLFASPSPSSIPCNLQGSASTPAISPPVNPNM
jgi:hypothetical protein